MRRRVLLSVSILAVLAIGIFVGGWLLQPKPRIDQESYDRIKVGMTLAEVEAIIGAPPGDYGVGTGEIEVWFTWEVKTGDVHWPRLPAGERKEWLGQQHAITVWVNAAGKVVDHSMPPVFREYDSTFDRLLGMLGLKDKKPRVDIL
jgi:hypothetical protein